MDRYPIAFSDIPDWAQRLARQTLGERCKPSCYVTAREAIFLGGSNDHERITVGVRYPNGEVKVQLGTYGGTNPFSSNAQNAVNQGGEFTLRPDWQAVQISSQYRSVNFFIHPDNATKFLPSPVKLTPIQASVLAILRTHTSAGRKDTWDRYHVSLTLVELVTEELASMQLVAVSKAGAVSVTLTGKQADCSNGFDFYSQWSNALEYDSNVGRYRAPEGSLPRLILAEYAERRKARLESKKAEA